MPRIMEMYAFVTSDTEPDDEGVIGMNTMTGWMPLVGADTERVDHLRVIAQAIADGSGKEVRCLRFAGPPEVLETFEPHPENAWKPEASGG